MLQYLLKRIALFIPTLLLLSLLVFGLSKMSTGDPIQVLLEDFKSNQSTINVEQENKIIQEIKVKYGLDKPAFYFAIRRSSDIQNYCSIENPRTNKNFNQLAYSYGNGEKTAAFYRAILQGYVQKEKEQTLDLLVLKQDAEEIEQLLNIIDNENITSAWLDLKNNKTRYANYIPHVQWNGFNNQYHQWLTNVLKGNLGQSYFDNKPIATKIKDALEWTLILSLISIFVALLIAIPAGVYAATHENSKTDQFLSKLFFVFYSIPNFWLASLLLVFFTSNEYFNWFPGYGVGDISNANSLWEIILIRVQHLFLPVFIWTYGSIAFVFKQVRNSMIQQWNSDYVKTAKAKGLKQQTIVWKHAFRNASFPLITIVGNILPAIFSGSFIIEYIFSIPGMGMLTIQAFNTRDYPVLFSIILIMGFLTVLGLLITDVLYAWNDPRIKLKKSFN
ncbi:MAG: ABC transporter permease [Bacteroidetes bacterium]|nr:MAG: ABC transporter permease [Bacteroidota bacterium]MBL1144979.1 ABC transporter permease [Bacteroidota bacterium]NOG57774.1 ABC transporter permease [Bacteroidota bacterium]